MRRAAAGLIGLLYGLLLLAIYVRLCSQNNWSPTDKLPADCFPGNCLIRDRIALLIDLFAPALAFCCLNAFAWSRWTWKTWAWRSVGMTVFVAAYWWAGYVFSLKR